MDTFTEHVIPCLEDSELWRTQGGHNKLQKEENALWQKGVLGTSTLIALQRGGKEWHEMKPSQLI